jgi:histidinol-phosphate aminotransferase
MTVAPTRIVAELEAMTPFLGGKALERRRGRPYRARLGANECLFGASPAALRAMAANSAEIGYYTDPTHFELRDRIAQAWRIPIGDIAVAEGIDGLLGLFVRGFVAPGESAVTSLGAYPVLDYHVRGYGGKLVYRPYSETGHNDLDALLSAVHDNRAKILFLANPDNPTGELIAASDLKELIGHLPEDCLLLLDEAYVEFGREEELLEIGFRRPNLVRLRTFSKAYGMAGARIGYAIADSDIIQALDRVRLHFGVSKLSQEMALAAFDDTTFLAAVLEQTVAGREHYRAIARMADIGALPSWANFVAFDFGRPDWSQSMADWFEARDIFVRRPAPPPLNRLIRVTVGPLAAREYFAEVLLEGVARLRAGGSLA